MNNILLDYFFPITSIEPTQQASTAFLKQALLVVKPKVGVPKTVVQCTSMSQVSALTDNVEAQQLFNGGLSRVYILPTEDLDLASVLAGNNNFFTVLISGDFDKDDVDATQASGSITITSYANLVSGTPDGIEVGGVMFVAQAGAATPGEATFQAASSNDDTATSLAAQINAHEDLDGVVTAVANAGVVTITAVEPGYSGNDIELAYDENDSNAGATLSGSNLEGGDGLTLGTFKGVVGVSEQDDTWLATQAAISNRSAFHSTVGNKAKNMAYAFGKLLSNVLNWRNQQYIEMPLAEDVDELGEANALFDDKISFVLSDAQYSNRLGLFAAGGKAIVAPYIKKNLEIDLQSAALSFVSGNQPEYSLKQAALLEDALQKVIQSYIDKEWITAGTVEVKLEQDNFVASGYINIAEPKALWRIFAEMKQTL